MLKSWMTVDRALILLAALLIAGAGLGRIINPGMLKPVRTRPAQPEFRWVNFSPAPVLKPGPVSIYHGKRVATWIVREAGDSAFNGLYAQDGTFNCRPCYTNGRRWLFYFNTGDQWVMDRELRSALPDYPYGSRSSQLPGEWKALKGFQ